MRKGQAKIDEFIWVVTIGMVVIAVLLFTLGSKPGSEGNTTENITEIMGEFRVGAVNKDIPRNIRIGDFSVSFTLGSNTIKEDSDIEIRKGLFETKDFKMSGRIDDDLDLVTGGFLVIEILDYSDAGNLIVKINDREVYNQITNPGEINIPLEKSDLKSYNVIELSASSPGWKFWSTSIYKIDKIKFGVNLYGRSEKTTQFQLDEYELRTFSGGDVVFDVVNKEGEGDLIIKINDKLVFKGNPSRNFKKSFDIFDVGLSNGANEITFSTETGTVYELDDTEIVIFHQETARKKRSFTFSITESDLNRLKGNKKGVMEFFIVDSNFLGSLKLSITDANGNEHPVGILSSFRENELIKMSYDDSDVTVGTNIINFETLDDGSFTLSNLEVKK
ncbi:MAG: hypothetical protein J4428_02205 [Candidatus Aenigmarchaeota archaeon]|nr:hypothetical protein [Candidatus Aenigmarchaeota archaeon]